MPKPVLSAIELTQQRLRALSRAAIDADDAGEATAIARARLDLLAGARRLLPAELRDKCWLVSIERAE